MSNANKLRVIVCRVGQDPVVEFIDKGLDAMQKIVGGYIECVRLDGDTFGHGIDLWCDEEFLLKDYCPNRLIGGRQAIHGDFFIAAHDGEGETIGLTEQEAAHWRNVAAGWPMSIQSLIGSGSN